VVGLAGCLLVGTVDPNDGSSPYPSCPFRTATGLDCPGCGGLRATHALTQGQLGVAADHNLMWVILVPTLLVAYAIWLARRMGFAPAPSLRLPRWWAPALFGVIAVFWVLRMLPGPFTWLASGA
jgi:hypothetical protein